jgi:hypothetical protein
LIKIFEARNLAIPGQLAEAERGCSRAMFLGEGAWVQPQGMKHVLLWEQDLINDIESLIYEALFSLDPPGANFSDEFKQVLGLDEINWRDWYDYHHWGEERPVIPPRPVTPGPPGPTRM